MLAMLTPCLAQCAATGMSSDDRAEWFHAAMLTLERIPFDLMRWGCDKARQVCDHPSKIVPVIMATIEGHWRDRRAEAGEIRSLLVGPKPWERKPMPAIAEEDRLRDGEAEKIMAEIGLSLPDDKPKMRDYSKLHTPTVADYVALGLTVEQAEAAVAEMRPKSDAA